MLKFSLKADTIGVLTSTLCLIHCFIAPFIFMAWTASTVGSNATPNYWYVLDYLFLIVSFMAIYKATKKTKKTWVNFGFWSSWILLSAILINENLVFIETKETLIFVPTVAIIVLHIFNLLQASVSKSEIRISKATANS
tara:strand:+ start:17467 stop:17883 length:417 start_codon:yes stop_codon:yes gene_type:complete